jgi:UDP-glucose 4-epimerase
MKIAVTGGSGFIGSAVLKWAAEAGHEAWSFDRADGNDVLGSLEALDGADHVIHLAGVLGTHELFDSPYMAVDVNVHGTLSVLEWCRGHGAGYTGITMPDAFPSIYTATKLCADRLATAYHHTHGVPVSRVRAFNAFGPGQKHGEGHPQKIIPTFATKAWAGERIPIWGNGTQTVDLVHADDLGRMLVEATAYGDDAVFDGGTGRALTVNEVADFIIDHVAGESVRQVPGPQYLPMRRGEVPTHIVARGAGWGRLGWSPGFTWGALAATVDSYRPAR